MSTVQQRPFVSVKFSPLAGCSIFLLPDLVIDAPDAQSAPAEPPLSAGEQVVVQTAEGTAVGTVTRQLPVASERKRPADDSPARVIRRAYARRHRHTAEA